MKTQEKIRISATFIWIGFVCAISFMEAWIKFTAPGVTLNTGLAIGQVVFDALNKVEITFALIILATFVADYKKLNNAFLITALAVLAFQSLYLLPHLSARIDLILEGNQPPPSELHTYYIGAELLKIFSLSTFGFKQLSV